MEQSKIIDTLETYHEAGGIGREGITELGREGIAEELGREGIEGEALGL